MLDEQHRLPHRQKLSDDVGDRLRLSRTRRTIEDQTGTPLYRLDRLMLAAIGIQDVIGHRGAGNGVQVTRFRQTLGNRQADGLVARVIARQSSCSTICSWLLPRSFHIAIF